MKLWVSPRKPQLTLRGKMWVSLRERFALWGKLWVSSRDPWFSQRVKLWVSSVIEEAIEFSWPRSLVGPLCRRGNFRAPSFERGTWNFLDTDMVGVPDPCEDFATLTCIS